MDDFLRDGLDEDRYSMMASASDYNIGYLSGLDACINKQHVNDTNMWLLTIGFISMCLIIITRRGQSRGNTL
jgi:hypothetical protein